MLNNNDKRDLSNTSLIMKTLYSFLIYLFVFSILLTNFQMALIEKILLPRHRTFSFIDQRFGG